MLNVAVCDDSDVFLQEAEAALRRYAQHVLLTRVNLVGYLIKPLDSSVLTCYLDKIYRTSSLKSFFTFFIRGQQISVLTEAVLYLESRNHTVVIHTDDTDYIVYDKLSDLSEQLPPVFVRCHKSFLVNMNRIQRLNGNEIWLSEELIVPVSKRYLVQTRDAFFRHIGQKV